MKPQYLRKLVRDSRKEAATLRREARETLAKAKLSVVDTIEAGKRIAFAEATEQYAAALERELAKGGPFDLSSDPGLEAEISRILTSSTERTNIRDTMQVVAVSGRKVGRPIESEHLFPAWLRSRNVTVTEWAAGHVDPDTGKPYKRERVKSWFAEGDGGRPAPRHAVDLIEEEATEPGSKKSAVPANRRTWTNGIRE